MPPTRFIFSSVLSRREKLFNGFEWSIVIVVLVAATIAAVGLAQGSLEL